MLLSRQVALYILLGLGLIGWNIAMCNTTNADLVKTDETRVIKSEIPSKVSTIDPLAFASRDQNQLQSIRRRQLNLGILQFQLEREENLMKHNKEPIRMTMGSSTTINISMVFDSDIIGNPTHINVDFITISPQFDILFPLYSDPNYNWSKLIYKAQNQKNVTVNFEVRLQANYIGNAIIVPKLLRKVAEKTKIDYENVRTYVIERDPRLEIQVIVIRDKSVWESVFIISVTILVVVSYANLGAQLDLDNLKQTVRRPETMLIGFLLTVVVMPIVCWFSCKWLIPDQLLYRIGSFVFAITPAASASTLWTVMLEADKELSVSLQVLSTFGSLLSMPVSLYIMDLALQSEGSHYMIKVPYMKLIQSLTVLMVALFVGWKFLGKNERLKKISQKVFKPFIFLVLIFIIIFSSTLYWFIYRMFNWTITFNSFFIALLTYIGTGALGYLINFNLDHAITISISSAYKNSGIAFAILLVAFEAPDYFIAYVPCLTQVVVTSLILYTFYSIRLLYSLFLRRNQPDPITAIKTENNSNTDKPQTVSNPTRTDNVEEEEEFIDVNVTDVPSNSLKLALPNDFV